MKETPEGMNRREFIAGAVAVTAVGTGSQESQAREHQPGKAAETELFERDKMMEKGNETFSDAMFGIILDKGVSVELSSYSEVEGKAVFSIKFSYPSVVDPKASTDIILNFQFDSLGDVNAQGLQNVIIEQLEERHIKYRYEYPEQ